MRGRKTIPTALQRVRGNPGRRPLNEREPIHAAFDPAIPDEVVDAFAREEWARLVATLTTAGHVLATDRTTLAAYCVAYGRWRRLEDAARDAPATLTTAQGTTANPILRLVTQALTQLLRFAAELGLTPSSRTRVVAVPPKDAGDAFAAFQRSRKAS